MDTESTGRPARPDADAPVDARAADVFTAELEARPGGLLRHRARIAGAFVSELFVQLIPVPSVHDVVVRRRDDGTEVLRMPAGEPLTAGDLLAQISAEIQESDPETFQRAWSAKNPPAR